jgi:hypothetical protein
VIWLSTTPGWFTCVCSTPLATNTPADVVDALNPARSPALDGSGRTRTTRNAESPGAYTGSSPSTTIVGGSVPPR